MRVAFYIIILFSLTIVSCKNETSHEKEETFTYRKEPAKTVLEFLNWYKNNYEKVNSIKLCNKPSLNDSNGRYSVNFDSTSKYIETLRNSGYISEDYLQYFNDYFKQKDLELKKCEQKEGKFISSDLEYDVFFEDQTQRSDFDSIVEHSTILNMGSDSVGGGVLIDFQFGYKRSFELVRRKNKWLINKQNIKS